MKNITLEVGDAIQYNFHGKLEEKSIIESIEQNTIYYTDRQFDIKDEVLKQIKNGKAILTKGIKINKSPKSKFPILIEFSDDGSKAVVIDCENIPVNRTFKIIGTNITIRGQA